MEWYQKRTCVTEKGKKMLFTKIVHWTDHWQHIWGKTIKDIQCKNSCTYLGHPWTQSKITSAPLWNNPMPNWKPTHHQQYEQPNSRDYSDSIPRLQRVGIIWGTRSDSCAQGDKIDTRQDGDVSKNLEEMSQKEKKEVIQYLRLKKNWCEKIKRGGCADSRKQMEYLTKDETRASTIATKIPHADVPCWYHG